MIDDLKEFFIMIGQKISVEKNKIFFSKNTSNHTRKRVTYLLGFKKTRHLVKYLGVPLTGRSPNMRDRQYHVEHVKAKLATWKRNLLSFASRVTLSKSFIEVIPNYHMMDSALPSACQKEI